MPENWHHTKAEAHFCQCSLNIQSSFRAFKCTVTTVWVENLHQPQAVLFTLTPARVRQSWGEDSYAEAREYRHRHVSFSLDYFTSTQFLINFHLTWKNNSAIVMSIIVQLTAVFLRQLNFKQCLTIIHLSGCFMEAIQVKCLLADSSQITTKPGIQIYYSLPPSQLLWAAPCTLTPKHWCGRKAPAACLLLHNRQTAKMWPAVREITELWGLIKVPQWGQTFTLAR